MALVILSGILSACGGGAPAATEPETGVKLHFAYNTEKLMRDHDYGELLSGRDSTLRMHGIRGKTESAQLIITPEEDVKAYNFEIKSLSNENGDKIKDIEVFYQWYIFVEKQYNPNAYMGYYPDALVPAKALKRERLNTIDLFKKAYFVTHDEPTGNVLEMVWTSDQIVSECKFAVADEYLKDYPDLYDSCIHVGHLVTTGYSEDRLGTDTKGGLQTWCPQFHHWHTEEQRQKYYERQNTTDRLGGEAVWWYGCNNPRAPYPTYHMDDELIAPRVLSWMQFDYNCDGNLYWCVNYYTEEDVWENSHVFDKSNGEGNLMYPGEKFGLSTPVATLRLESIREGLEDYEYLWMLEQAILSYNGENGTDYDPENLMAPLYEGMIVQRDNAAEFLQRRVVVLKLVEQFEKDPAAASACLEDMK